jgi:F-type H+-transporting ATPase subunit a
MFEMIRRFALLTIAFSLISSTLFAADSAESESDIPDFLGYVADHDNLEVFGKKIYLPRILLVDGEWFFFANSHSAVESGFFIDNNHVLEPANGKPITIDLSITSHLMYFWFAIGLTLYIFISLSSRYKKGIGKDSAPAGYFQNIIEVLFLFIRDDIAKENIGEKKYMKYVPYLVGMFFVILFMNLFGLLPWGATATADLTVTTVLALTTFLVTQFSGTKDHWTHVFMFPGVHPAIRIILTPIEIIGLFTKPFALCVRLFANMFSGKLMVMSILGLAFILGGMFGPLVGYATTALVVPLTAVLYVLKAFVALLQAYIFTMLSAVFIGMAAEEHEHHAEHAH